MGADLVEPPLGDVTGQLTLGCQRCLNVGEIQSARREIGKDRRRKHTETVVDMPHLGHAQAFVVSSNGTILKPYVAGIPLAAIFKESHQRGLTRMVKYRRDVGVIDHQVGITVEDEERITQHRESLPYRPTCTEKARA